MKFNLLELDSLMIAVQGLANYRYEGDKEKWLPVSAAAHSQLGIGHIPVSDVMDKLIAMRKILISK